jgi:hypothetical protein
MMMMKERVWEVLEGWSLMMNEVVRDVLELEVLLSASFGKEQNDKIKNIREERNGLRGRQSWSSGL